MGRRRVAGRYSLPSCIKKRYARAAAAAGNARDHKRLPLMGQPEDHKLLASFEHFMDTVQEKFIFNIRADEKLKAELWSLWQQHVHFVETRDKH